MPRFRLNNPAFPDLRPPRNLPLGSDELLKLDNERPRETIPPELADACSDRRVFVSDPEGASSDCAFDTVDRYSSVFQLKPGAFLGRTGRLAETIPDKPERCAEEPSPPFRPPWAGYLHHPKQATISTPPDLRRADGRRMRGHAVYDPDNRSFFVPSDYPQQCVGRLKVWDVPGSNRIRTGTATLVGRRTIVTAAHLMPRDGSPGKWGALFIPAYFNGISMVGMASWCEAYRMATTTFSDATQAFDVAVMKLYDPLGEALGWFGSRTYDSDWEDESRWTLIGYPGFAAGFNSEGEWPTMENGVRVIDDDPDGSFAEIEHMGDASQGNSGGPLFGTWPDGPYVIAVHSGDEYRTIWTPFGDIVAENNNVAAGGNGMVNMIRAAQTDWP